MSPESIGPIENFSKGSPETRDMEPFTARDGDTALGAVWHLIISHHHKKKGENSTIKYFERAYLYNLHYITLL